MNDSLFQLVVSQTIQVTLLAVIVLALTKFFAKDRPHLAHALWALVLLKCMMPPIIASPTSIFSWLSQGYAAVANKAQSPTEIEHSLNTSPQSKEFAQVIARVSARSNTSHAFETQANSPLENSVAPRLSRSSLVAVALYVWLVIAACVFVVSALRLWIFMRRVKKRTLPTSPSLNVLVKSVSKRIGLRRAVQIRTIDAAIGPAVVGLIWPTILLPKMIVDGKADSELEPLLAHELIHIRRGDLVWAMLQGTSVSLWWFNPFVWLAERLLTREAERSCDEETIASLGCSPAAYARSLLDVMERKHQMRAAPSLPGVRPVDITAKRLERIIRLGNGCYRQRPWWVVVVWLTGCLIALPGAAWVVAQEKPKQQPGSFNEAKFILDELARPALPSASEKQTEALQDYELRSIPVDSELQRLRKEMGLKKIDAEKQLIQLLLGEMQWHDNKATPKHSIVVNGEGRTFDISMGGSEPPFKILDDVLYVCATAKELKQVETSLGHFRKFGFKTVTTEVELYEIPRVLKLDDGDTVADVSLDRFVSDSQRTSNDSDSYYVLMLDPEKVAILKRLINREDHSQVSRPLVKTYFGQPATIEIGTEHVFTTGHSLVKAANGKVDYQPVKRKFQTGFRIDTLAVGRDDSRLYLEVRLHRSELEKVIKRSQKYSESDVEFTTEHPSFSSSSFEIGAELTSDQSLVLVRKLEQKTLLLLLHSQQQNAPLPTTQHAGASDTSRVVSADWGLRVVVPAIGPIPLAFDFTSRPQIADCDQNQAFSFFMGFSR